MVKEKSKYKTRYCTDNTLKRKDEVVNRVTDVHQSKLYTDEDALLGEAKEM